MSIAKKIFTDRQMWKSIYEWNQEEIKDPNLIFPGQVLQMYKAE